MTYDPITERFITDQMCSSLERLQDVRSFDFDGAYRAAFSGLNASLARHSQPMVIGMALALDVWRDTQHKPVPA